MDRRTYFFTTFRSRARTVRSIDFAMTLIEGVIGELASFRGLKLSTVEIILLPIEARVRMRLPKLFRVAVTRRASLCRVRLWSQTYIPQQANLISSCRMLNSLSNKPEASASRLGGGMRGWSRGTRAKEISLCSGRYYLSEERTRNRGKGERTRGSAIRPGVWVWTTRCTNLMQQMRTPGGAPSMRRRIFDLIWAIFCQFAESWGLLILQST